MEQNNRKIRIGKVISNSMDKTAIVVVEEQGPPYVIVPATVDEKM